MTVYPFPHCGDDDPTIDDVEPGVFAVCCNDCGAIGPRKGLPYGHAFEAVRAVAAKIGEGK
jgi:hypothetical protein